MLTWHTKKHYVNVCQATWTCQVDSGNASRRRLRMRICTSQPCRTFGGFPLAGVHAGARSLHKSHRWQLAPWWNWIAWNFWMLSKFEVWNVDINGDVENWHLRINEAMEMLKTDIWEYRINEAMEMLKTDIWEYRINEAMEMLKTDIWEYRINEAENRRT